MMVPATEASMAMHCVQAQMRCIIRLSVSTPPLVNTFAIDAINPKANNRTDRLDASSKTYKIAVSSFSMEENCFMGLSAFLCYLEGTVKIDRRISNVSLYQPLSEKFRTGLDNLFPHS